MGHAAGLMGVLCDFEEQVDWNRREKESGRMEELENSSPSQLGRLL